jgi:hypothetical protein
MKTERQEVTSKKLRVAEAFGAIPDPLVAGQSKHELVFDALNSNHPYNKA